MADALLSSTVGGTMWAATVIGLQLGAFAVVLETVASGISSLPFEAFVLLMQPIHLSIGIVEGLVTAAVVAFVWRARPEILQCAQESRPVGAVPIRSVLAAFLSAAALTGGIVAWFASEYPDGLEWSIAGVTGSEELPESDFHSHDFLLCRCDVSANWVIAKLNSAAWFDIKVRKRSSG